MVAWARRHSLPLTSLAEPVVARHALHAITCKRAVFRNAPGYAAGLGLLPANPVSQIAWRPPHPCAAGWPQEQVTSPTSAALSSSASCGLSKLATTCCER